MGNVLMHRIHHNLDDSEDIFNVDWDTYYATIFVAKEKIKFKLVELASSLPYNLDTM